MSSIEFIYTDKPLKKLNYSVKDMIGADQVPWVKFSGSPAPGVRFSEEELHKEAEEAAGHLFPGLKRYLVRASTTSFQYNRSLPADQRESERKCLEWLLNLIRMHLKDGAEKFYYASLWYTFDPDVKKPKMKKIDLAKFIPDDNEFEFGRYTIWEFVDSSIGRVP